jgi:arylsulfatase A-like enzyme
MKTKIINCVLIAGLVFSGCNRQVSNNLPNFVVIFIDDMGYGEIEPFGSTVNKTPSLNEMANEGTIFTDFYVSWTACTPSRATLLTGCYARRVGMDGGVCFPVDRRGLNPDEQTIAEVLKTRGYATGCFGKWHLGDQPQFLPTKQGFDEYVGIPYSNDMYRGPFPWSDRERVIEYIEKLMSDGAKLPHLPFIINDEVVAYIPDGDNQALMHGAITDAAVDFIKRHKNEPFFAYVPFPAIHGPIFVSGMSQEMSEYEKVYSAHIGEVDASVGEILNNLKEMGIDKNTFVLFTSDNGGSRKYASHGPLRGYKGYEPYEGRMREPFIAWWPGKIPAGKTSHEIIASIDILPTLASLAGAQIPTDRIIDGHDVSDLLLGKPDARSPHDILYHETDAIRKGQWKLVDYFDRKEKINRVELYNLQTDVGEKNDLSELYPEKVIELQKLLRNHVAELDENIRLAAFVDDPLPLVTLEECENLPTLEEYLNNK